MSIRSKLGLGTKANTTGFTPRANLPRSDVQSAVEYVMDNAENVGTVYAPTDAEYITSSASGGLSNERVLTDTASITWDFGTLGQAKASFSFLGMQSLSDPGADRIMFWDDSAGSMAWLRLGTGLSFVGDYLSITDANLIAIRDATYAQGDILFHNGTVLTNLAAGSDGQFLKTHGAGTSPTWEYISGGGDMVRANNLSDITSASDARINLGLVIGTDVQAADADLTSWASVTRAAGFDTFAATPSSLNLKTLITDETGSGALVFATSPTLVTPALGTPSSGTLTSCTGLPVSTGISGLGTGVATFLATPSSANLAAAVTDETGTGALVFAISPTFTTPILGTPTSGTLTNCTGLPISTGVSGLGVGVSAFLATPSSANLAAAVTDGTGSGALVFATSPTLVTPALGTPSSINLTNATSLPVSAITPSTITSLGIGTLELGHATDTTLSRVSAGVVAIEGVNILTTATGQPLDADLTSWAAVTRAAGFDTFATTPSSANLAALVTNETGSGSLVFATSPTLVTPILGTPTSGTLTNCTGLPISTGVSGLATGIATFLATPTSANLAAAVTNETGSGALVFATSPTLVTPLLGTPTSGTLTNCTGLPVSTGVSGLGTGVATFLATPSSANLAAAVTDETGSGSLVFGTGPTLSSPAVTGTADIQQEFRLSGDITPTQLAADTNDWAPTGLSTASVIRASTDASRNLTGLTGGADGRILLLHNIGSFALVLKDESASSVAANRFALSADVTLAGDQSTLLQYDSTSSRWRVIGGVGSSGGSGDVTAAAAFATDNRVIRSDGTGKGVQASGITIDDSDNVSGVVSLATTTIELGHATDTTLSRTGAGDIAVEGNAIYRTGGTDVPISDGGTGASTAAAACSNLGVGLVLLTSGTVSAAATLDIVLSSYTAYRSIKFHLTRFIPATDDVELWMRVSTDGGSTYDTTGYSFVGATGRDNSASVFTNVNSASTTRFIMSGSTSGGEAVSNVSGEGGASLEVTLYSQTSANWQRVSGHATWFGATVADTFQTVFSGSREASQDTDAVRFLFESGNITSGTYAVYGLL